MSSSIRIEAKKIIESLEESDENRWYLSFLIYHSDEKDLDKKTFQWVTSGA
jgi:hypothetical protein